MSFIENTLEEIFGSKKDKNYIRVKSYYHFLEILTQAETKCTGIKIPQTILIENGGNYKSWMFNSKKDPNIPILKKRPDKLNAIEVIDSFSQDNRLGGTQQLLTDYNYSNTMKPLESNKSKIFVRYINDKIDMLNIDQLQDYIHTGLGYLKIIQSALDIKSKSDFNSSNIDYISCFTKPLFDETYYCEYRYEDPLLPPSFRFAKKVLQYSNPSENVASENYKPKMLYMANDKNMDSSFDARSFNVSPNGRDTKHMMNFITQNTKNYYKVLNQAMKQKLEKVTKNFVSFVTNSFEIIIKKVICKFALDAKQEFYFLGVKEMLIEFKNKSYAAQFEGVKEVQLEDMINSLKRFAEDQEARNVLDDKNKVKNKKMSHELCQGDFCEFISLDSYRLAELSSGSTLNKFLGNNISKKPGKIPFEITYNLVRRCKQNAEEIKTIFRQHKIFPRYYAEIINDSPQNIDKVDFDINFKKMEYDSVQTLYRFVKICPNCYPIYVTLQRVITKNETKPPSNLELTQTSSAKMTGLPQIDLNNTSRQGISTKRSQRTDYTVSIQKQSSRPLLNRTETNPTPSRKMNLKVDLQSTFTDFNHNKNLTTTHDSFSNLDYYRTVQTTSRKERQKTSTQRLNLGISTRRQNFEDVTTTSTEEHSTFRKKLLRDLLKPVVKTDASASLSEKTEESKLESMGDSVLRDPALKEKLETFHIKTLQRVASNVQKLTTLDSSKTKKRILVKGVEKVRAKEERPLIPMTTLYDVAKDLNLNTALFELRQFLKKRREIKPNRGVTSLYHHGISDCARAIPHFLTTTPKLGSKGTEIEYEKLTLTFKQLCEIGDYKIPTTVNPDLIKVFVIDQQTAIPYAVIGSTTEVYKCYDVVLVCNDIFGDFIQDIEFYQEYAKTADNVKFILFNIPGQAYTLFDEQTIYNNDYNASMIDLLLEELTTNKAFNPSIDTLKFIGIGFGANIFLYFNALAGEKLFPKSYILAINPFVNVDSSFRQALEKSLQTIKETPDGLPEMPILYFNLAFGNGKMTDQEALDQVPSTQIKKVGRVVLLNSVLESFNIKQAVSNISCPIVILHTLQNALVDNQHVYSLQIYKDQYTRPKTTKLKEFLADQNSKRLVVYTDGSYAAFQERAPGVMKFFDDFINAEVHQSNLLDWVFSDKYLKQIESDLAVLQELELEEARNYIRSLSNLSKFKNDELKEFLQDAEDFSERLNERIQKIQNVIQKSEENILSFQQTTLDQLQDQEVTKKTLNNVRNGLEERLRLAKIEMEIVINTNKEPIQLLLILAKNVSQIDEASSLLKNPANEKLLTKSNNILKSMKEDDAYDGQKLQEIISFKNKGLVTRDLNLKLLHQAFKDGVQVETKYKTLPSVLLFDYNLHNFKVKATELETVTIRFQTRLISLSWSILDYLQNLKISSQSTFEEIHQIFDFALNESKALLPALRLNEAIFIQLNLNIEDFGFRSTPQQFYADTQSELANKFAETIVKQKIQNVQHNLDQQFHQHLKSSLKSSQVNKIESILSKLKQL